uniref:Cap binding complex dependent translation initiation factor n=1 Tax=Hippocampus comes TaxID=109280 RepID=A0A3Q2YWF8_HIPCM
MESSSVASASSEAGSTRSQEIEELERFIDSYVLEYQVQGLLGDKVDDDLDLDDGGKVPQVSWTDDCNDYKDGSWTSSQGRSSSKPNGNKDVSFDILGTDIWAANTMDSRGGTGWDVQPEKLDFSHLHRKHTRVMPKHLPHIDREGMSKNKFEEDDGVYLNDIEKFLPHLCSVFPPLPNEAEIAHTKKLFRPPPTHANNGRSPRQYQGGHGQRQGGHPHGYSQNRRWHPNQKAPGQQNPAGPDRGPPLRATKEIETVKVTSDKHTWQMEEPRDSSKADSAPDANALSDVAAGKESPGSSGQSVSREPQISLLRSSKERLERRLKDKVRQSCAPGMDRLLRLLNSMRSNSGGVEEQLASFMEEAQSSARSEETLSQVVDTIYDKAVSDRSFAATAAKLCNKMALFMVDGTKFRSLLLNLLQKDFARREELRRSDVEVWLGFITFLCEVFGIMRSSSGEPFRVLVCPIYTCLRELLQSKDVKDDAVLCCSLELQSAGHLLEEQLPEMMTELLVAVRDKMLSPAESPLTRSLLMEVVELHAHCWSPLEAPTTQYYDRTIHKLTTTTAAATA